LGGWLPKVSLFFSKADSNFDLTLKATDEKLRAGRWLLKTLFKKVDPEAKIYGAALAAAEFSIF
jgi:hypothetical protein